MIQNGCLFHRISDKLRLMKDIISRLKKIGKQAIGLSGPLESSWLTGQFLVAMPGMSDPRFARSVIYMCSHGPSGAMGLVINRLFGEADFSMLLRQLSLDPPPSAPDVPVQFGGPVEMGRGFILHSSDYVREGTTQIDDRIAVTASLEIVQDIAQGKGPERLLLALGYSGWGTGQLEEELRQNGWLTLPADETILFSPDLESKWDRAFAKIGIHPSMLSGTVGHA